MKNIFTNKNEEILLDDEDYEKYKSYTWYLDKDGYPKAYFGGGRKYAISRLLHRLILKADADEICDHINGIRTDCRKGNLRKVNRQQNATNVKMHKDNKCGYKGVYLDRGIFRSRIMVNNKAINLGRFKTVQEAHEAYCKASIIYHKEYGKTE